jgi:hypothetical protein
MKQIRLFFILMALSFSVHARVFQIFGIDQDIPMGVKNEVITKNYYVNLGSNQGIKRGSILNVFRNINKYNPYENKKRANYHVKIGELEVIHTEGEIAITIIRELNTTSQNLSVDVDNLMIGDDVMVKIKN